MEFGREELQEATSRHTWQAGRRLVVDECGIWFGILLRSSWSKGLPSYEGGYRYGSDGDELIRRFCCCVLFLGFRHTYSPTEQGL
mgnify:CR=1 FL=1